MKTAGEIFSVLFDEGFAKKAQGYSKFFDSWTDIAEKNGIAAAAAHSRIKDLDRGIVLIETDHPGWKQILQTKQSKLLNDFRRRFPELEISGISLMLGSAPGSLPAPEETAAKLENAAAAAEPEKAIAAQREPQPSASPEPQTEATAPKGYGAIKDEDFRESLIKLGQTVAAAEKNAKRKIS